MYQARQVHPEVSNLLYKAYLNVTTRPHGYLLLDLAQDTDDLLRFPTCILPDEYPTTFHVDVNNETDKIITPFMYSKPHSKFSKAIISNRNRDLLNCISECIVKVLNGNLKVSDSAKQKL